MNEPRKEEKMRMSAGGIRVRKERRTEKGGGERDDDVVGGSLPVSSPRRARARRLIASEQTRKTKTPLHCTTRGREGGRRRVANLLPHRRFAEDAAFSRVCNEAKNDAEDEGKKECGCAKDPICTTQLSCAPEAFFANIMEMD